MIIQEIKLYEEPIPVIHPIIATPLAPLSPILKFTLEDIEEAQHDSALLGIGIGTKFKYCHGLDYFVIEEIKSNPIHTYNSKGGPTIFGCNRYNEKHQKTNTFVTTFSLQDIVSTSMEILS